MIIRTNCWEFKQCGREPGGSNVAELGECPVCSDEQFEGVNRGKCAGRFCWTVAGTLCGGKVQGAFAKKFVNCLNCTFFLHVQEQEGRFFILTSEQLRSQR